MSEVGAAGEKGFVRARSRRVESAAVCVRHRPQAEALRAQAGTSLKLGVANRVSNDYGPVERALDRRHRSRGGGSLGETKVKRA
jgi:hypothetical protein